MKPWQQALLIAGFGLVGSMAGLGFALMTFGPAAVLESGPGRWVLREVLRQPPPELPDGRTMLEPGQKLPDLVLPDTAGQPQPFSQWRGRPVLVNFWASWCGPCVREMPLLDEFSAAQEPIGGVRVIGVALDDEEAVAGFLAEHPVRFPILIEPSGPSDSSVLLGNRRGVLPYSVLIDAEGVLVRSKLGAFEHGEIEEFVAP
jgi:thiol-disulfide isomerase/thioredoxin